MTITFTIATDNAAFTDDRDAEVLRILQDAIKRFQRSGLGDDTIKLRDYNGNTVGTATIREEG